MRMCPACKIRTTIIEARVRIGFGDVVVEATGPVQHCDKCENNYGEFTVQISPSKNIADTRLSNSVEVKGNA